MDNNEGDDLFRIGISEIRASLFKNLGQYQKALEQYSECFIMKEKILGV